MEALIKRALVLGALEVAADPLHEGIDESKFKELVSKLQKQGKSKEYATKIAAKVGDEKYGKEGMAKKSAGARGKNEDDMEEDANPGKFPVQNGMGQLDAESLVRQAATSYGLTAKAIKGNSGWWYCYLPDFDKTVATVSELKNLQYAKKHYHLEDDMEEDAKDPEAHDAYLRQRAALKKAVSKGEPIAAINAWGQDEKTAKEARKAIRAEKSAKTLQKKLQAMPKGNAWESTMQAALSIIADESKKKENDDDEIAKMHREEEKEKNDHKHKHDKDHKKD